MSSEVFQFFISAISDNRKWQVGLIHIVPWVSPTSKQKIAISKQAKRAFECARSIRQYSEVDHNFYGLPHGGSIEEIWLTTQINEQTSRKEIANLQNKILSELCVLYRLNREELIRMAGEIAVEGEPENETIEEPPKFDTSSGEN